jgi:hypothetical protein
MPKTKLIYEGKELEKILSDNKGLAESMKAIVELLKIAKVLNCALTVSFAPMPEKIGELKVKA